MEKIARLNIRSIYEATAIADGEVNMVSTGAQLSISKDGSALVLKATAGSVRYNKTENEDLELPVLQNELAGLVGDFDNNVHKLFTKYGYQWVNDGNAATATATEDEGGEDGAGSGDVFEGKYTQGDPVGTWVGDYLVLDVVSLSRVVDTAAAFYGFDDQKVENKFRQKVGQMIKDDFDESNIMDDFDAGVASFIEKHQDDLAEFADYYGG